MSVDRTAGQDEERERARDAFRAAPLKGDDEMTCIRKAAGRNGFDAGWDAALAAVSQEEQRVTMDQHAAVIEALATAHEEQARLRTALEELVSVTEAMRTEVSLGALPDALDVARVALSAVESEPPDDERSGNDER